MGYIPFMAADPEPSNGGKPGRVGRKATFDRDAALDIALELFWRHGYDGVGIADLTKAIGIAPPSLYHAFGSKADLFREVLRKYGAGGVAPADIEQAPSARDAVEDMLARGIQTVTSSDRPLGCMISSGMLMTGPENAALAAEVRSLRADLRTALQRRIERDAAAGLFPSAINAAATARFYASVLQGFSVQALDGATRADLQAAAALAMAAWPAQADPARLDRESGTLGAQA